MLGYLIPHTSNLRKGGRVVTQVPICFRYLPRQGNEAVDPPGSFSCAPPPVAASVQRQFPRRASEELPVHKHIYRVLCHATCYLYREKNVACGIPLAT